MLIMLFRVLMVHGEFLKSLISDGNGGFIEFEYTNLVSFYHGGATGDYDNDGDLDVLVEAGRGQSRKINL